MNNLFIAKDEHGLNVAVHEKYDIKGSTVKRSADPPVEGQSVNCKNCEQKFIYHKRRKGKKSRLFTGSLHSESTLGSVADLEDDANKYVVSLNYCFFN